ncbi:MAG: M14 family zinc carboxypeptidase [Thermoplasmatota archaeon]
MAAASILLLFVLPPPPTASIGDSPQGGWRPSYHTYASMTQELRALEAAHPGMVRVESLGRTYEGRDIWAVKLSDDVATNDSSEPDVLIMGGLHAREVMGVEVPLHVLNHLIRGYGTNESCTMLVNTRETWFVPMANPDGHVFVEGGNDWRKNRRPTEGGSVGVDLNRNWGYMFGVDGHTSADPSSDVYHGPYPFSENETVAISQLALRQRFATALSFHSYGELILYPWGFTTDPAPDGGELASMAEAMASANGYSPMQSSRLYIVHGDSEDWLYANASALAFTIELDTSFYPPESQIEATCALNREAAIYLISYPRADILDAGVRAIVTPANGSLIEPDRALNITVDVMNYGTGVEDIPVEIELASPEGYSHRSVASVALRPGQTGEVRAQWLPPFPGAENYTLLVRTNATGDTYGWNDAATASFRVKTRYGAALSASETAKGCFAGQSVVYRLNVSSLSNREDNILLELEGLHRDWARIVGAVHLPPAGGALVNMTVSVPRGASPGERASIAVRALSSTGMGASGLVSTTTTVLDPSPRAEAGPDVAVNVTEEVDFDGSESTTPVGSLVRHSWDFGDGNLSEGVRVRHSYGRRGVYTVNLTVESDLGWTDSDSLTVAVEQLFGIGLEAERAALVLAPGATAQVNLTLRNLGNGPDMIELTLDALRWSASIDTSLVQLGRGESCPVRLCVTAPPRALAGETALFRVTAASMESVYTRDDVLITAAVAEVRELVLETPEAGRSSDAGRSVAFALLIHNGGNVEERIELTPSGVPEGWEVEISMPTPAVPPWSSATVEITIRIPREALAGAYELFINGLALEVVVLPRYALEASVERPALAAGPGESAAFLVNVTNAGNAPDSYALRVEGLPEGWGVEGAPPALDVAPGRNGSIRATVLVARGARAGRQDLTLELRSGNDTGVLKSIPVQVLVERAERPAAPATTAGSLPPVLTLALIAAAAAGALAYQHSRRRRRSPVEAAETEMQMQSSISEALPVTGMETEGALPAEVLPTSVAVEAPTGEVPPPRDAAGEPAAEALHAAAAGTAYYATESEAGATCLWCLRQIAREPRLTCPSCGGTFHLRCAPEAGRCTRCGGALRE